MRSILNSAAPALQWIYRGCGFLAALSLIILGVLILTSVLSRMAGLQLIGLTSYATYAMASSWFMAMAYTFGAGEHIRVNLLTSRLSGVAKKIAAAWALLVALAITGMLTYYAFNLAYFSWLIQERSQAADATLLWIPQISMVVGTAVLTLAIFEKLLRLIFLGEDDLDGSSELDPNAEDASDKSTTASPAAGSQGVG